MLWEVGMGPRWTRTVAITSLVAFSAGSAVAESAAGDPLITRAETGHVRVHDSSSGAAFCPQSSSVVSGGFANPNFSRKTGELFIWGTNPVVGPFPLGPSWRTTVANLGNAATGQARFRVYAYCDPEKPRVHEIYRDVKVGPRERGAATIRCPKGSEAISGGLSDEQADLGASRLFAIASKRKGDHGWRGVAYNKSRSHRGALAVIAECERNAPSLRVRHASRHVPRHGTSAVEAHCGKNRYALSGGFRTAVDPSTGKGAFPLASLRPNPKTWHAAGFGKGAPGEVTAFAYCAR
jgi:hypothetical protein